MDARSLWNGVAGVKAHAEAMHSVADNIANTNTVGYKGTRAEFGDILYSTLNGGSVADLEAQQLGYGSLTQLVNVMNQGAIIQSESPLDLAIDGDGFFTVADPITPENIYYTRAGQFIINEDNQLVNPQGYTLLGYTVVDGELNTDEIVDLEIDTGVLEGAATTVVEMGINLNAADSRVFDQSVNIDPSDSDTFNAALPINIYDDDNTIRQMRIYFQRSGQTDTGTVWKAAVYENQDGTIVQNPAFPNNVFYMQFDGDGALVGTASDAILAQGDIYESDVSFSTSGGVVSTAAGESLTYTGDGVEQTYLTDALLVFTLPTQAGDTMNIGSDTYTSSGGSTAAESASELADAINAGSSRSYYAIDNGAGEVRIVAKTASDLTFSGPISINPQVSTTLNQLVQDINTGATSTGVVQLSDMAASGSTITIGGTHNFTINAPGATTVAELASALASDIDLHADYTASAVGDSIYITYSRIGTEGNLSFTSDDATNMVLSGTQLYGGLDSSGTTNVEAEASQNADDTYSLRLLRGDTGSAAIITVGAGNTLGTSQGLDFNAFTQTGIADDGTAIAENDAIQSFEFSFDYTETDPDTGITTTTTLTQEVDFDFKPENSTSTTMQAGNYEMFYSETDGSADGYLQSAVVDKFGYITGLYNNGREAVMGQVALSHFVNPDGLARTGDNLWQETEASGEPVVAEPGDNETGMGHIIGSALESSTVDLADEMVNMINYQRAYQANSKSIQTTDEILKVAINLIG